MRLFKIRIYLLFVFLAPATIKAQVTSCYIEKKDLTEMTKQEFLNADSIKTDNPNFLVSGYTVVLTTTFNGQPILKYKDLRGAKIDSDVKDWVRSYDSCQILFDYFYISEKTKYPWQLQPIFKTPPIRISIR